MASVLATYKGLYIVTGATGDGGLALTSNFQTIADKLYNTTSYNNSIGTDTSNSILSGFNNSISAGSLGGPQYSVIVGGQNNYIYGLASWTCIGSGYGNRIRCGVGSGTETVTSHHSLIDGGFFNTIGSYFGSDSSRGDVNSCVIGGGQSNYITLVGTTNNQARHSTISGGYWNNIIARGSIGHANAASATIGGGEYNAIDGFSVALSIICGGKSNSIRDIGGGSSIIGGSLNAVSNGSVYEAYWSVIGGGYSNRIGDATISQGDVKFSSILGGEANWIKNTLFSGNISWSAICGGAGNLINSANSGFIGGGESNAVQPNDYVFSADYAFIAGGYYGLADHYGQFAQASGRFASIGDAQTTVSVARITTTNTASVTEMFLDGASVRLTLLDADAWFFNIMVVARGTAGTNDNSAGGWELKGVIKRIDTTTSLVGTVIKTIIGEDIGAWDVNVDAQDHYLRIQVTGDATSTINWVARIQMVEVNG